MIKGRKMAQRINFTKAALKALPLPPDGERLVFLDTKMAGLQVRVTANGVKAFSVFRRTKGGPPERITVGRFPDLSIEQARKRAAEINAALADAKNPAEIRRASRAELTFAELFAQYLDRHAKPRKRTWDDDEAKFRLYLAKPLV
jgi:hypothetical protein